MRNSAFIQMYLVPGDFGMVSCSPKNTFINRTFHNLSGEYNGLYNATLKLEEVKKSLLCRTKTNTTRLSVFQYADKPRQSYFSFDGRCDESTANVISHHTIQDKHGNEFQALNIGLTITARIRKSPIYEA